MSNSVVDGLVLIFAVVFYAFLCVVYILRGLEKERAELALAVPFSLQIAPFAILFALNVINGSDIMRPVTLLPILAFLLYDLWYRLLTKKKPIHHPKKWPMGLVAYILLMNAGCIGLNWYGYLISKQHGYLLVACYFIMLGCFGFYQGRHKRSQAADIGKH
jgi:hypothetical protein